MLQEQREGSEAWRWPPFACPAVTLARSKRAGVDPGQRRGFQRCCPCLRAASERTPTYSQNSGGLINRVAPEQPAAFPNGLKFSPREKV